MSIRFIVIAASLVSIPGADCSPQFAPAGVTRSVPPLRRDQYRIPNDGERRGLTQPGPVATVLGSAGFIAGWIVGTRRDERNRKVDYRWRILYGSAFALAGAAAGTMIDVPVRRARNAEALRSGSCLDTAVFVRLRGGDTIAVEVASLTSSELRGEIRSTNGFIRYVATLSNDLVVLELEAQEWTPGVSPTLPPTVLVHYRLHNNNAMLGTRGAPPIEINVPPNVAALLGDGVGLQELVTRRAIRFGERQTATLDVAGHGERRTAYLAVTGARSITMRMDGRDLEAHFNVDESGRIQSASYFERRDVVSVARGRCGRVRNGR